MNFFIFLRGTRRRLSWAPGGGSGGCCPHPGPWLSSPGRPSHTLGHRAGRDLSGHGPLCPFPQSRGQVSLLCLRHKGTERHREALKVSPGGHHGGDRKWIVGNRPTCPQLQRAGCLREGVGPGSEGCQVRRRGLHLLTMQVGVPLAPCVLSQFRGQRIVGPLPPLAHCAPSASLSGPRPRPAGPRPRPTGPSPMAAPPAPVTHGMPISNRLFWMSCLPSMMMLSWMQSSIRQPPGAHCGQRAGGQTPGCSPGSRRQGIAAPGRGARLRHGAGATSQPWTPRRGSHLERGSWRL